MNTECTPVGIEHSVLELVRQRVYGIALGYEDLNDHDDLKWDPLLALALGKRDVEGKARRREADRGKVMASSSTLNRLELTPADADPRHRPPANATQPRSAASSESPAPSPRDQFGHRK